MGSFIIRLHGDVITPRTPAPYECGWCHDPFSSSRALIAHVKERRGGGSGHAAEQVASLAERRQQKAAAAAERAAARRFSNSGP